MFAKNPFSVKATLLNNGRRRDFDGPWRPTVEEAVLAFTLKHAKTILEGKVDTRLVFTPYLAERCDESVAPCCDNRGNYFREPKADLPALLRSHGYEEAGATGFRGPEPK